MESKSGKEIVVVAPFVLKTYEMVNDPLTDALITWGTANNSFLVFDPLHFSHTLLPAYFKHNNFSSFVRQLNTYGFRKVDPDRWEFANEWFLRGQYHLLRNIVRRKQQHSSNNNSSGPKLQLQLQLQLGGDVDDNDNKNEELASEIAKLRKEQRALEEELEGMKKRLETTEKRPHQMMAFLQQVVHDPEILPRMMLLQKNQHQHHHPRPQNKRISSSSSSPSTTTPTDDHIEEDPNPGPNFSPFFHVHNFGQPSSPGGLCSHVPWMIMPAEPGQYCLDSGSGGVAPMEICLGTSSGGGGEIKYLTGAVEDTHPPPPYPFSLFGSGF